LLKVAVLGATGRMGRAVLSCVFEADDLTLIGAVTEPGDRLLGRDAAELVGADPVGVPLTDERTQGLHAAQVAIDFTLPSATEANLRACVASGTALVIGTTGLEDRHQKAMEKAAHEIPVVYARNMSVGVNVFLDLVGRAAKALGDTYDVEIIEAHHRHKVDAPSRGLPRSGAVSSAIWPCTRDKGASGRVCRARSASPSFAGATSWANTPSVSSGRRSRWSSRTRLRIARLSRVEPCARRAGRPVRLRGCIRWPMCSV
jgi:4-hydroxy-tetrahydrodipicolinate reductase